MNKLAISIRNINDGNLCLNEIGLSTIEQSVLQVMNDLMRLSPQVLADKLSQQADPSEWIVPPMVRPLDNPQI